MENYHDFLFEFSSPKQKTNSSINSSKISSEEEQNLHNTTYWNPLQDYNNYPNYEKVKEVMAKITADVIKTKTIPEWKKAAILRGYYTLARHSAESDQIPDEGAKVRIHKVYQLISKASKSNNPNDWEKAEKFLRYSLKTNQKEIIADLQKEAASLTNPDLITSALTETGKDIERTTLKILKKTTEISKKALKSTYAAGKSTMKKAGELIAKGTEKVGKYVIYRYEEDKKAISNLIDIAKQHINEKRTLAELDKFKQRMENRKRKDANLVLAKKAELIQKINKTYDAKLLKLNPTVGDAISYINDSYSYISIFADFAKKIWNGFINILKKIGNLFKKLWNFIKGLFGGGEEKETEKETKKETEKETKKKTAEPKKEMEKKSNNNNQQATKEEKFIFLNHILESFLFEEEKKQEETEEVKFADQPHLRKDDVERVNKSLAQYQKRKKEEYDKIMAKNKATGNTLLEASKKLIWLISFKIIGIFLIIAVTSYILGIQNNQAPAYIYSNKYIMESGLFNGIANFIINPIKTGIKNITNIANDPLNGIYAITSFILIIWLIISIVRDFKVLGILNKEAERFSDVTKAEA